MDQYLGLFLYFLFFFNVPSQRASAGPRGDLPRPSRHLQAAAPPGPALRREGARSARRFWRQRSRGPAVANERRTGLSGLPRGRGRAWLAPRP